MAGAVGAGRIIAAIITAGRGFIFRRESGNADRSGVLQYMFRVGNNTLIQTIVPDALRCRVMSIYMLDNGLTPLATMGISFWIHIWSPAGAYTSLAAVSLILALLQLVFFRRVRDLA